LSTPGGASSTSSPGGAAGTSTPDATPKAAATKKPK
jgi:hypothetical protein